MKLFTIVLLLFLSSICFSQEYSSSSKKAIKEFEKGKELFMQKEDVQAESFLLKALDNDSNFIEAWFMLAQIYFDKGEKAKSVESYLKGLRISPDNYATGFLKVADIEYSIGMYDAAWEHLIIWKNYNIATEKTKQQATELENDLLVSLKAVHNPVPFSPVSLGPAVNTEYFEYWPSLSIDEKTIFFTVLSEPNPDLPPQKLSMQEDFYFAIKTGETWNNRTYLGPPVNTNANEGAQSITADGKLLFFTACDRADGHGRMCDIYVSYLREDGGWSEPINLGDGINSPYSEKHPSISPDGRILYFTSNRPGGKGSYDIWVSYKDENGWNTPINLGDSINTAGIEQSPFIHPDQKTLYFSSNGWPGLGQGDILLSRLKNDGSWSISQNLGYPINTFNEEIGFIVNARGTKAYYATNRREGTDTDIYSFDIPVQIRPNPVSYISGRVYDARNMKGIKATFQLFEMQTGTLVSEISSNPGEGGYLISLPTGSSYVFNVSWPGYMFYSEHFELDKNYSQVNPLIKDIALQPIRQGKMIVLKNIFFDTESYTLKEESVIELNKIFEFLDLNKNLKVEISGHTDNTGSKSFNLELSQHRANSVVDYLRSMGIASDRLIPKGYGSSLAIGDNDTEDGKALNRRTELKVL